ncbi:putative protein kinase, partial [Plasmodium gaboni]
QKNKLNNYPFNDNIRNKNILYNDDKDKYKDKYKDINKDHDLFFGDNKKKKRDAENYMFNETYNVLKNTNNDIIFHNNKRKKDCIENTLKNLYTNNCDIPPSKNGTKLIKRNINEGSYINDDLYKDNIFNNKSYMNIPHNIHNVNHQKDKEISLSNNISMLLDRISDNSDNKKNTFEYGQNNYHDHYNNNTTYENSYNYVNTINYNDNLNMDTNSFVISDNYICQFGLSSLYKCKLKNENNSFLINVIDSFYLNHINGNDIVANNILFHKRLRHINILSYKGKTADKNKLYLLFQNIHGNILKTYSTPLEETIIACYAYQIIDLLEYMHNNFIIFQGK